MTAHHHIQIDKEKEMKKRLLILTISLLALTAIPGCGFSTGAATTSKEAVVTSSSLIETSSKSDQGMVIVEIPGDMIGNNPDALLEKINSNDIKVEKMRVVVSDIILRKSSMHKC